MGCGAVCGNNSSIYQPNNYSQNNLFKIAPLLTHSSKFITERQFIFFLKQIKQNPLKYRLKVNNKLIPKQEINPQVLLKWKVILYCLDTQNSQYNNCLGQKSKMLIQIKQDEIRKQKNQNTLENIENQEIFQEQYVIYRHDQFSQIEKDIDRTCDLSDSKKKTFQKILKRISNQFPSMGYTQGINFIIGYLLMIGFSQFDTFWMFVNIAINKRYLLLGLFQDGFPLSQIYKIVFKNILKRQNSKLYSHFYQNLNIDESVWVFKWFFTYFIYSFPHQMIKYVFDIVVQIGGIGLVSLAIAISEQLTDFLLTQYDICQISIFFQSLRDINIFNAYIDMKKVVQRAFKLQIKKCDFEGIDNLKQNFYTQYIKSNLEEKQNDNKEIKQKEVKLINSQQMQCKKEQISNQHDVDQKSQKCLKKWYTKLIKERNQFILRQQSKKQKKNNQRISIENQMNNYLLRIEGNQKDLKSPEKQEAQLSDHKNSYKDSTQIKNETIPSTGYSFNKKSSRLRNNSVSQIDELWQEEERNSSISKNVSSKFSQQSRTQNGFDINIRKISYQDQLDKLAATQNNNINKNKYNNTYNKTSSIFNVEKKNSFKPKINNFQIPSLNKTSNLVRTAKNIITNNLSISENSQHQSDKSQSQCSNKFSQKQKKQKESQIYGKNYYKSKNMKQKVSFNQKELSNVEKNSFNENNKSINDHNSSSIDSCLDPHNSFCASNDSIQDEIRNHEIEAFSMKAFETNRQRMTTQQDILVSSLHISQIKGGKLKQNNGQLDVGQLNGGQIEIYETQVFKKKNRVSSRINGAINNTLGEGLKMPKLTHTISEADIFQKGQKIIKKEKDGNELTLNYEESYESIMVPSEGKKSKRLDFRQQTNNCQIESVR